MRILNRYAIILLFLLPFLLGAAPSRTYTYTAGNKIQPDEVTTNEDNMFRYLQTGVEVYADGTIVSADITDGTIVSADISDGTVTSADIANETITTSDILDGTIANADVSSSAAIAASKLTLTNITTFTAGGDLDIGSYELRAQTLESDVVTGTAPLTIASTTKVTNLNADTVDGLSWSNFASNYFESDGTCVLAFNAAPVEMGSRAAITLTSLAESDLVAGKVSPVCYDFDGTSDYALIADNANFAGSNALTIEAWIYADGITGTHSIVVNQTNGYIALQVTSTNVTGQIVTSSGTEAWSVAHGLTLTGQWVYIAIAWNNSGVAEVYVNGSDVGDGDNGGNGTVSDSAGGIYIGVDNDGSSNKFNGKIDGARILRRKMGATEVLNRYNAFN